MEKGMLRRRDNVENGERQRVAHCEWGNMQEEFTCTEE